MRLVRPVLVGGLATFAAGVTLLADYRTLQLALQVPSEYGGIGRIWFDSVGVAGLAVAELVFAFGRPRVLTGAVLTAVAIYLLILSAAASYNPNTSGLFFGAVSAVIVALVTLVASRSPFRGFIAGIGLLVVVVAALTGVRMALV